MGINGMVEGYKFPALFLGLKSPSNDDVKEGKYYRILQNFANSHPNPQAIVVMSAYWVTEVIFEITGKEKLNPIVSESNERKNEKTVFKFQKGNPALARSIAYSLKKKGIKSKINNDYGLDYGALLPMNVMYPERKIPIIQISVPIQKTPKSLFRLGQGLRNFRNENVLFIGSGNTVFNERIRHQEIDDPPSGWAKDFDDFVEEHIFGDLEDLFDYEAQAPNANYAVTEKESIYPLFFVLGLKNDEEKVKTLFEGFEYSTTSLRSFFLESDPID